MALDHIKELQLQTLINAILSDSKPLRGKEMEEAIERMVLIHGNSVRSELDQRLLRERSRNTGGRDRDSGNWDRGARERRRQSPDNFSRMSDGNTFSGGRGDSGPISFRQAGRGSDYDRPSRGRSDNFDRSPYGNVRDRYSPPRSRSPDGRGDGMGHHGNGRDPYASRTVPRDGEGWSRNGSRPRGGSYRDGGRGGESVDPRIAHTALSHLRMLGDGNLVLPTRHVQRGVVLLYPLQSGDPLPPAKVRPDDCHTAFVGGLPPRCREHHLRDAFGDCGEIKSLRLKVRTHYCKTFAHIEFEESESVEKAVAMCGWYIKVDRTKQPEAVGRLMVDYANEDKKRMAKGDDTLDYSGKKRSRSPSLCSDLDENDRAGPAAKKIKRNTGSDDDEEEYEEEDGGDHRTWDKRRSHLQSPSQLSFSDTALANLTERFENGDRNLEPYLRRVSTWLSEGQCTDDTRDEFFSLLQAILCSHMRRVSNAKQQQEKKLSALRQKTWQRLHTIAGHVQSCSQLVKVLREEKILDDFSAGQVKNLQIWMSEIQNLKASTEEDMLVNRLEAGQISSPVPVKHEDEASLSHEELLEHMTAVRESLQANVQLHQAKMAKMKRQCRVLLSRKNAEIADLQQKLSSDLPTANSSKQRTSAQTYASSTAEEDSDEEVDRRQTSRRSSQADSDPSFMAENRPHLDWAMEANFLSEDDDFGKAAVARDEEARTNTDDGDDAIFAGGDGYSSADDQDTSSMMILLDEDSNPEEDYQVRRGPAGASRSPELSNESASIVAVVSSFLLVQPYGSNLDSILAYLRTIGCSTPSDTVRNILDGLPLVFARGRKVNGEDDRYQVTAFQTIGVPVTPATSAAANRTYDR